MRRVIGWRWPLLGAALLLALPAGAESHEAQAQAEENPRSKKWLAAREVEKKDALAVLKRASDFLGDQKNVSLHAEVAYDSVQSDGQQFEFGGSRDVTLRRPNRVRVDASRRHGDTESLYFDGKTLTANFPADNAYASVEKPGDIDATIDYLVDDLGTPAPLSDLLYSDFYAGVVGEVRGGFIVGDATLEGVPTQHLAFHGDNVDFQIWVAKGDRPVPVRVVITYHQADGEPSFRARLRDWNFSKRAPDSFFVFTPPKGAERLPFAPRNLADLQGKEAP